MENFLSAGVSLTGLLGAAAFLVSAIVEVTKNLPFIDKIHTQLWCMIVSVVVCCVGYTVCQLTVGGAIVWYRLVAAFAGSFITAYVAMYGWDTIKALWDKFTK